MRAHTYIQIHMYQYKHIRTERKEKHTLLVLITMSTLNETGGRHFDAENGTRLTLVENYNANQTANSNRQSLLHICVFIWHMERNRKKKEEENTHTHRHNCSTTERTTWNSCHWHNCQMQMCSFDVSTKASDSLNWYKYAIEIDKIEIFHPFKMCRMLNEKLNSSAMI